MAHAYLPKPKKHTTSGFSFGQAVLYLKFEASFCVLSQRIKSIPELGMGHFGEFGRKCHISDLTYLPYLPVANGYLSIS